MRNTKQPGILKEKLFSQLRLTHSTNKIPYRNDDPGVLEMYTEYVITHIRKYSFNFELFIYIYI